MVIEGKSRGGKNVSYNSFIPLFFFISFFIIMARYLMCNHQLKHKFYHVLWSKISFRNFKILYLTNIALIPEQFHTAYDLLDLELSKTMILTLRYAHSSRKDGHVNISIYYSNSQCFALYCYGFADN